MKQEELINLRKNITYKININRDTIFLIVFSVFLKYNETGDNIKNYLEMEEIDNGSL